MVNTYYTGSLVRMATYSGTLATPTGGFRDVNGNLADPTTVVLKYKPGSAAATVTITFPDVRISKDAVGLYHADVDTTGLLPAGVALDEWTYEWIGTGAIIAPALNIFEVKVGL
jgi:hypothetical protein